MIGGLDFLWDFNNFPINDELINNFRTEAAGSRRRPIPVEDAPDYDPTFQYRTNAYGMVPQNRTTASRPGRRLPRRGAGGPGGNGVISSLYQESRLLGKANLDWQADRYNRLRFGGEFTRYDHRLLVGRADQRRSSRTRTRRSRSAGTRFAEDRLDLGDVVVVGGLRYDFYDSRASRPNGLPGDLDPCRASIRTTRRRMFIRDKSHHYLSPHVQVSFPVTDRTNFRLSYAHQVQAPDFGAILTGINTDINRTNPNQLYGADLDFGRTIAFEFGVRHAFSDDMVLDIAAYNRDVLSDAAGRTVSVPDPTAQNSPTEIRVLHQRRLRQHPRRGRPARPPVRQLLLRHAGLHLPAGQEHGRRPAHLHLVRVPHREPARRRQHSAPAGDPHHRHQPAAHAGVRRQPHLPGGLPAGHHARLDLPELRRLRHRPVHQRHGVHRAA